MRDSTQSRAPGPTAAPPKGLQGAGGLTQTRSASDGRPFLPTRVLESSVRETRVRLQARAPKGALSSPSPSLRAAGKSGPWRPRGPHVWLRRPHRSGHQLLRTLRRRRGIPFASARGARFTLQGACARGRLLIPDSVNATRLQLRRVKGTCRGMKSCGASTRPEGLIHQHPHHPERGSRS